MAADAADGVVGSGLVHGCNPDHPRSRPPLAAEDDLNPEYAKEGLGLAQPASECAGTPWPARPDPCGHSTAANIGADLPKGRMRFPSIALGRAMKLAQTCPPFQSPCWIRPGPFLGVFFA
jgi:hypothetical protein